MSEGRKEQCILEPCSGSGSTYGSYKNHRWQVFSPRMAVNQEQHSDDEMHNSFCFLDSYHLSSLKSNEFCEEMN